MRLPTPTDRSCPRRATAARRRTRVRAVAAAAALLLAACTQSPSSPASPRDAGGSSTAEDGTLSATLNEPTDPVTVLADPTPGALAVATSAALFRTAPVVVVAASSDPDGIAAAADQAVPLGVPLLLADVPAAPSTASPSPAPTVGDGSTPDPLIEEIRRLAPEAVLALGPGVADRLADLNGVEVVTDVAALPAVTPAPRVPDLTVLVHAGPAPASVAGESAAAATVRAAGGRVVPVRGDDPRADPKAITQLAEQELGPVLAAGSGFGPPERLATRLALASTGLQLPGGGQVLFPGRLLVALYGHPGTPSLGVLGEQGVQASIDRAKQVAAPYVPLSQVPVVPTFEIIATVAQGDPGGDGDYSYAADPAALRPLVEQAGAAGMYVVLDLQPGRADSLAQAKLYEPLLRLPYVGLALDPEWKLGPGELPLQQVGGVDAAEINTVIAWLSDLVTRERLPQKLFVLHQFRLSMIRNELAVDTGRDNVAVLIHMDGQGPTASKDSTWASVTGAAPPGVPFGWKNFYDEDSPVLTPEQTIVKEPTPVMISYQ